MKTFLHFRHRCSLYGCCVALVALATNQVSSQTTPAANPPATTEEKVVELTPFEVRADLDTGYQGIDTASGSRLNTKLRDTPARRHGNLAVLPVVKTTANLCSASAARILYSAACLFY